MKRTRESEGDDEDFDDDGGDAEYHPEADDAGVFWCPHCGSEMYGDSTRCPKCGDDVTPGTRSMPWWIWILVLVVAFAILAGLIRSF